MSGHGANPIFFNKKKKKKFGRPEHSLTPHPLHSITSHFCLIPPLQSGRQMCITPFKMLKQPPEVFNKKAVFKIFAIFTEIQLC